MTEKVVYFSGCYANYYDPRIGEAFVEVMETNGIEVLLAQQKCCGMPMMSNGNMKGAKKNFNEIVQSLSQMAAGGLDIVTTCPSCSLMLKKEGLPFFDSEEARFVSSRVLNAPEYLVRLFRQGRLNTRFSQTPLKVLYHSPCHLKVRICCTLTKLNRPGGRAGVWPWDCVSLARRRQTGPTAVKTFRRNGLRKADPVAQRGFRKPATEPTRP